MDNIVSLASYYGEINQLKQGRICRPRMLVFYPTYVCNQQCYYCFCKQYRSSETMPTEKILDLFKEVYDYGVRGVEFCGGGEPLCHPDIAEIFIEAKKIGLSLGLLTNGSLFSDDIMNAFISNGNYVRISLETIDPLLYRTIRGTDDCQKVLDNIDDALGYKELVKSKCQISIKAGLGKDITLEHLQQMIDYFSQRKITSLQIKHLWDDKGYYYNPMIKAISLENLKKHDVNLIKKVPQKKIAINKKCWINPLQVTIDTVGDVQLCCYYMNRGNHKFGNVYKNTFQEIWESPEHLESMSKVNNVDCQKHDCRFIKYMRTADYLYKCKDWNFI